MAFPQTSASNMAYSPPTYHLFNENKEYLESLTSFSPNWKNEIKLGYICIYVKYNQWFLYQRNTFQGKEFGLGWAYLEKSNVPPELIALAEILPK